MQHVSENNLKNAPPRSTPSSPPLAVHNTTPTAENDEPNIEYRMQLALNAVMHKGETPTCAARKWHLNRTAILQNILLEKKRQGHLDNNVGCDNESAPPKLFQSKFTSNQLLSAQQEERLANYLKQCYDMQWQHMSIIGNGSELTGLHAPTTKPPLLCEEVARSFTHNFVHMHKLKYPSLWDAKQQAASDWFNGFVDRNPEVIEYVAPSTRERKQRKRTFLKLEASCAAREGIECSDQPRQRQNDLNWDKIGDESDIIESDYQNEVNLEQSPFRVKAEPDEKGNDLYEVQQQKMQNFTNPIKRDISKNIFNNDSADTEEDPMIPEATYKTKKPSILKKTDLPAAASIAESVKRRTMRKPRILAEHLYAAEMAMETEETSFAQKRAQTLLTKKLTAPINPIKIQKVQTFHQGYGHNEEYQNIGKLHERKEPTQMTPQSVNDLKESIETMHSDMNYLLQSMLMEMSENNRLLRRLISNNESRH